MARLLFCLTLYLVDYIVLFIALSHRRSLTVNSSILPILGLPLHAFLSFFLRHSQNTFSACNSGAMGGSRRVRTSPPSYTFLRRSWILCTCVETLKNLSKNRRQKKSKTTCKQSWPKLRNFDLLLALRLLPYSRPAPSPALRPPLPPR